MNSRGKNAYKKNVEYSSIGVALQLRLRAQKINKSDLARRLEVSPTTVHQYLKSRSLHCGIVWRLSKALNYNFFADMAREVQVPFISEAESATRTENEQLKAENAQVQARELEIRLEEARRK